MQAKNLLPYYLQSLKESIPLTAPEYAVINRPFSILLQKELEICFLFYVTQLMTQLLV